MSKIGNLYQKKVQVHLIESAEVKRVTSEKCMDSILKAAQLISDTFASGGKVLLCGNGGSAADCQHMAAEFVCVLNRAFDRSGLPAIALTTDTSVLTAHANDMHFDAIFERQVQALGKPNDLLIGISTSGNSKNVIAAVKRAKSTKIQTLALSGNNGKLRKIADVAISVPSANTQYIQETHIAIEHILCELVEDYLFAKKKGEQHGYK